MMCSLEKRTKKHCLLLVCCRRISATESIDSDERRWFGEAVCPGTVILACCALVPPTVSRVRSVGYIDGVGLACSDQCGCIGCIEKGGVSEKRAFVSSSAIATET